MDAHRRRAGWPALGIAACLSVAGLVAPAPAVPPGRDGPPAAHAQDAAHIAVFAQAGGAALAVAVDGNLAVAGIGAQLVVLGIADPDSPREVYRSPVLSAVVADVDVANHVAYAVHGNQLLALDLAAPGGPRVVSDEWFHFLDDFRGIEVHDGYAYVLLESLSPWGLGVIDVRDPRAPVRVTLPSPDYGAGPYGWAHEVAASGRHVYAVGDALRVVDASDPAAPVRVGELDVEGTAYGIDADGNTVLVATDNGENTPGALLIYDVTDPARPALAASLALRCRRVAVSGRYAYVGLWPSGLAVVDVVDPRRPTVVRTDPFGAVGAVAASPDRALVAVPDAGVTLLHGAVPASERTVVLPTWSPAVDVAVDAGRAYVAHRGGLAIVDVSSPDTPRTLADVPIAQGATRVVVDDAVAYVAGDEASIVVLDVADPRSPARAGSIALDAPAHLVSAAPGRVAVVTERAVALYDTSDAAQPRALGAAELDAWEPTGLAVTGESVFVGDRRVGLRVFAPRPGAALAEVARVPYRTDSWNAARGIAVEGSALYVPHGSEAMGTPGPPGSGDARHSGGVGDCPPPPPPEEARILQIDIGDPLAPRPVTDFGAAGWPRGLAVENARLFVASGFARYYPTTLIARDIGAANGVDAETRLPAVPDAVVARAGRAFVADGEAGLIVAEVRMDAAPTLTPTLTPYATRPVSPSPTRDPDATPTATPPWRTATPRSTPTSPFPTATATPTAGCGPWPVLYVPVAHRGG